MPDLHLAACVLPPPHWTAYVTAISTPIIAAVAALFAGLISYRQWRTAQDRLKLDLFTRRQDIYEATYNILARTMTSGNVTVEEIIRFVARTKAAKWVLSKELASYLHDEIYDHLMNLESLESEYNTLFDDHEKRVENVNKQREVKNWLQAQHSALDEKFTPYLRLRH